MLLTKRKRSQNKQRMKPVKLELVANFCAFVRSDLGIRGIFVFVPFGWALVLRGTMSNKKEVHCLLPLPLLDPSNCALSTEVENHGAQNKQPSYYSVDVLVSSLLDQRPVNVLLPNKYRHSVSLKPKFPSV